MNRKPMSIFRYKGNKVLVESTRLTPIASYGIIGNLKPGPGEGRLCRTGSEGRHYLTVLKEGVQ